MGSGIAGGLFYIGHGLTFDGDEIARETWIMTEKIILLLIPVIGLSVIAAVVWWQNERDYALRKERISKKK
jgi:hypothetical protein